MPLYGDCHVTCVHQVAVCLYEQALVRWWLQTPSSSHLAGRIGQCLESDHGEVKLATTACLQEWLDSGQQRLDMQGWHHVQVGSFVISQELEIGADFGNFNYSILD